MGKISGALRWVLTKFSQLEVVRTPNLARITIGVTTAERFVHGLHDACILQGSLLLKIVWI